MDTPKTWKCTRVNSPGDRGRSSDGLTHCNVKAGLTAKAAGGKILKVESLTKNGKLVAYEAKVEAAGKKSEIQVGPDGKPLDHEE